MSKCKKVLNRVATHKINKNDKFLVEVTNI